MEQEQRLWDLLAKEFSGKLSEKERVELDILKTRFPEAFRQYELLNTLSFRSPEAIQDERQEEMLGRIFSAVAPERRSPRRRRAWLAAIPLAAAACVGIWFWASPRAGESKTKREWSTVQTRKGNKSKLTLPDGTEVILNAGSTLTYADGFKNGTREVRLTGEGYFKVAAMADHPFIVHTPVIDVKVLGTEFNIQAYDDENRTETTLFSGKVEVQVKGDGKRYMLAPRQKLAVLREMPGTGRSAVPGSMVTSPQAQQVQLIAAEIDRHDSSLVAGAWVDNKFVFTDEPLASLARRLERWYNVEVEIQNEALKDVRFTGSVENEPLLQILEILTSIKPIKYKMTGSKVTIY